MDIFELLIIERKRRYISQGEICSKLGVNSTTLSRYEKRKRDIPFSVILKYAEALQMEFKLQMKE